MAFSCVNDLVALLPECCEHLPAHSALPGEIGFSHALNCLRIIFTVSQISQFHNSHMNDRGALLPECYEHLLAHSALQSKNDFSCSRIGLGMIFLPTSFNVVSFLHTVSLSQSS